jgi:2,3-bisphosphoglycerate-dependent phosphoglycerate mutase
MLKKKPNLPILYLIRHASPDWARTDIPYDIPPGPPLTPKGKEEAQALGVFLETVGLQKLYYSPLERSAQTAQIAAAVAKVPAVEQTGLAEWRKGETEPEIQARFWPLLEASLEESAQVGPLGWVTHGGPVAYLLKQLGMEPARLEKHRQMFDRSNPLPPAGVWSVQRDSDTEAWDLQLAFTPPQGS